MVYIRYVYDIIRYICDIVQVYVCVILIKHIEMFLFNSSWQYTFFDLCLLLCLLLRHWIFRTLDTCFDES